MPRKGPTYPINADWQRRVMARITEMGISQNELGRRAKVSKASMSDALTPGAVQSACVPAIHRALGWPEPPLVLTPDALELVSLYVQMGDRDQGAMVERARTLVEGKRRGTR